MAELLGVPANTLSRWETGITVPDANALSAIISIAKEHGMEPPSFFDLRNTRLRVGSKPLPQSTELLHSCQSLRGYLAVLIEQDSERPSVLRIQIRNTAPVSPDWPKIVFTGVRVSLAHTGGASLQTGDLKTRTSRGSKEEEPAAAATPWQHDEKLKSLLRINYVPINREGSSADFPDLTPNERNHGEALFPGEFVIFEVDIKPEHLPHVQFRVEGTVSRRHLFHCEEVFSMPEAFTKPLAVRALQDYAAFDLHEPLESAIKSMPEFESDPRLKEVQNFSRLLSEKVVKIQALQRDLNAVFREHEIAGFRAHIRAAFIYLDRVSATLLRMKQAIESNVPDKIAAEASAMKAMKMESAQLDHETQDFMHRYGISEEELAKSWR